MNDLKSRLFKAICVGFIFGLFVVFTSLHAEPEAGENLVEFPSVLSSPSPNLWFANTLSQISDAVRQRTSEIVRYIEQISQLPSYIDTLLDQPNSYQLFESLSFTLAKILTSLALALSTGVLFSFFQKRISSRFPRLNPLLFQLWGIFLTPLVFFGTGFLAFSLLIDSHTLRDFLIQTLFLSTSLCISLRGLMHLEILNFSKDLIASLTPSLKALVHWLGGGIILNIFLHYTKIPYALSTLIFWIIGFIVFSLFTNCVLKLKPFLDAWLKKKDFKYKLFKTSSFGILLSHWHFLVISSGFLLYLFWAFKEDSRVFFIRIFSSILVLIIAQLSIVLWHFLLKLWTDTSTILSRLDPVYSQHIRKFINIMGLFFHAFLYGLSFIVIGKIWGVDLIGWIDSSFKISSLNIVIDISITLILGISIWQLVEALFQNYMEKASHNITGSAQKKKAQIQRLRTLLPVFQNGIRWILSSILLLMILSQAGIDITPLLTGLGIFGLALSFGAQNLIKDFITGLNILLDGSLNVGDLVTIKEHQGLVETLTLRHVELRDTLTGAVHIIPFSQVELISNFSKDYNFCSFEIDVLENADIPQVINTVQEVLKSMQEDPKTKDMVLEPAVIWGLKKMDGLHMSIDGRFKTGIYLTSIVKSEFNKRLQQACKAKQILLSSPAEIVYLSSLEPHLVPPINTEKNS